MGERRGVHYLRKFYPWYLAGEPVAPDEVAALLVIEEYAHLRAHRRCSPSRAPLATTPGLN